MWVSSVLLKVLCKKINIQKKQVKSLEIFAFTTELPTGGTLHDPTDLIKNFTTMRCLAYSLAAM